MDCYWCGTKDGFLCCETDRRLKEEALGALLDRRMLSAAATTELITAAFNHIEDHPDRYSTLIRSIKNGC